MKIQRFIEEMKLKTMRITYWICQICFCFILTVGLCPSATGQHVALDLDQEQPKPTWLVLPFVFYTESFEFTFGAVGGTSGLVQPQMGAYAALLGTSNDTYAGYALLNDFQIPFLKRLFIDFAGSVGHFTDQRAYVGFSPDFPGERAGSNESSNDNFISGKGDDNWADLTFRYLLPLGHGKRRIISEYRLDRGLLVAGASGGPRWNPLRSGRTSLDLVLFRRKRDIDEDVRTFSGATSGLQIALEYDNRDFFTNPTSGSRQKLSWSVDGGWLDSKNSWSVFEFEISKYFSLGDSRRFRQRSLAINFWMADTPTWDVDLTSGGQTIIDGRPPPYRSPFLGGFDRLRAYDLYRFSDKAAVLYSAELRLIPQWHPLAWFNRLKFLQIDWWQFVPFAELGRVAPSWDIQELHTDMKWDLGLGLRFLINKSLFRIDTAFTENGTWSAYAMVGHPF